MSKRDPHEDRLLEHSYDGIQEYDNPMPKWWLYILYATVLFSILYALNLPGIGTGKGRIANYQAEMAAARAKFGNAGDAAEAMTDDQLLALSRDGAKLADGKTTFTIQCAACHRADGGGSIGPNLTDDYWVHGNMPTQILKTVSQGVLDKGMPAWSQILKPGQVPAVVAYVLTLRGTNPPNPKAPQGVKVETESDGEVPSPGEETPAPH